MRRLNLSLSETDYAKVERYARFSRLGVGPCAREWLMWIIETKLEEHRQNGNLARFEQLELFPKRKGGKS